MFRIFASSLFLLSCGISIPATAQDYARHLSGPAASAVIAYIEKTRIPCYTHKGEGQCRIAESSGYAGVHYGAFPGDPARYAIAFIQYQYDQTGNASDQMAVLFRAEGERFAPLQRLDNAPGGNPKNVQFLPGKITYTGSVLRASDTRATPTGQRAFTILVTPNGLTLK